MQKLAAAQHTIECLKRALMDSINAPKGVVPDSALPFYAEIVKGNPNIITCLDEMSPFNITMEDIRTNRVKRGSMVVDNSSGVPPVYVLRACYDNSMAPKLHKDCRSCPYAKQCAVLHPYQELSSECARCGSNDQGDGYCSRCPEHPNKFKGRD